MDLPEDFAVERLLAEKVMGWKYAPNPFSQHDHLLGEYEWFDHHRRRERR